MLKQVAYDGDSISSEHDDDDGGDNGDNGDNEEPPTRFESVRMYEYSTYVSRWTVATEHPSRVGFVECVHTVHERTIVSAPLISVTITSTTDLHACTPSVAEASRAYSYLLRP